MKTFAEGLNVKDNALGSVRILFSLCVIVFHTFPLLGMSLESVPDFMRETEDYF